MKIQLLRIDDRLIHGQVVIGWVHFLGSKKIILCDNSVAENEWEKELYLSVVPKSLQVMVLNVQELAHLLADNITDLTKTIIVINSPIVLERLIELNAPIEDVNIGGLHFKEPRKQYLSYLFLSADEIASFGRIQNQGINLYCQDVPNSKKLPLISVLSKKGG